MSYCPECGKKSADQFAVFCGYCQASLKSLGASPSTKPTTPIVVVPAARPVSQATFPPVMISQPSKPKSRAELLREQRMQSLYPEMAEAEASDGEDGVNVQRFDPSSFTGMDIEVDNTPTRLGEKMFFNLTNP